MVNFSRKRKKSPQRLVTGLQKRQAQALRVFRKISSPLGSIFLKKLAFLKPSTP